MFLKNYLINSESVMLPSWMSVKFMEKLRNGEQIIRYQEMTYKTLNI